MHLGVDLWTHQVNPIHSGTRNPGLALSKGCHPGQSRPASPHPSLPDVVSGTVAAGLRRIASKWQKGTLQRTLQGLL
ncbi:hypothetical protein J3F83DRAFT_723220 [Trichoderma novae-zelandiae]